MVTALGGVPAPHAVALSWTNPVDADYASAVVRRAPGLVPPSGPTAGTAVAVVAAPGTGVTDSGLATATYSYAVFTRDALGNTSAAASATFTLPAALTVGATDLAGAVSQVLPAAQTLADSGDLSFTAFALGATRTVTVSPVTASPLGSLVASVTEPTASLAGAVTWSYSLDNELVRQLDVGETVTETFRLTITDGPDSEQRDITVVVSGVDDPPTVTTPVPTQSVTTGTTATFGLPQFTDADLEPLTLTATGLESWMTFSPVTGFSVSPVIGDQGGYDLAVLASDGDGAPVSSTIHLDVTLQANVAPVAGIDTVNFDLAASPNSVMHDLLANDTDDGLPTGSTTALPATGTWQFVGDTEDAGSYSIDSAGELTLTISPDQYGPARRLGQDQTAQAQLQYTVTDGDLSTAGTVNVTVTGVNDAPILISPFPNQQVTNGSTANFVVPVGSFVDPDGDMLTYSGSFSEAWGTFFSSPPVWTFLPPLGASNASGSVTADDGHGGFETATFNVIAVDPVNTPPVPQDDTLLMTLQPGSGDSASTNVLLGDTDDGLVSPLLAVPATGDWFLDGDSTPAGTYTITADGETTVTTGTDDFGPLQHLAAGDIATGHISYTVTDGDLTAVGALVVTAEGALDPLYRVGELSGPDGGVLLDFNDPTPNTWDATGMWDSPDPYTLTHSWSAVTPGPLPSDPVFSGANLPSLTVQNAEWGIGSDVSLTVSVATGDGRAVVGGASDTVEFLVGEPVVNEPPTAGDDAVDFNLRFHINELQVNVLGNDTDDGPFSAVPASGTFDLNGELAGTYDLAVDGTLTLTSGDDLFGPLQKLEPAEVATIDLQYQIDDGEFQDTADITVTVTGRLDPYYLVAPMIGPDNGSLDYNQATPTTWDASQMFDSPDPGICSALNGGCEESTYAVTHQWSATSTGTVPQDPAFINNANVTSVTIVNNAWGFDSVSSITVTLNPSDGRPLLNYTVHFVVTDAGDFVLAAGADSVAFDLQDDPDSASANVLANDSGGTGTRSVVPASGSWTVNGETAGGYSLAADGTLSLDSGSDDFGVLQRLGPGETATGTLTYTLVDGSSATTGTVTITVTGRLDPVYEVGQFWGPGSYLYNSAPGSSYWDASTVWDSPDPFDPIYLWYAESATLQPAPYHPAFLGADVSDILILNSDWPGVDSWKITVVMVPADGRPTVGATQVESRFDVLNSGG